MICWKKKTTTVSVYEEYAPEVKIRDNGEALADACYKESLKELLLRLSCIFLYITNRNEFLLQTNFLIKLPTFC